MQFSEIERRYPDLSGKMLSRRVNELFDLGLIGKAISRIQPLEFKYRITEKGKMLKRLFYELSVTGTKLFRQEILENPNVDTSEIEAYFKQMYLE